MKPSQNTDDADIIIEKCLAALGNKEAYKSLRRESKKEDELRAFIEENNEQRGYFEAVCRGNKSLQTIEIIQKSGELKTFATNAFITSMADYFKVYQRTGKTEPLVKRLNDAVQLFDKAGKQIAILEATYGNKGENETNHSHLNQLNHAQLYTATMSSLLQHGVEAIIQNNKKSR